MSKQINQNSPVYQILANGLAVGKLVQISCCETSSFRVITSKRLGILFLICGKCLNIWGAFRTTEGLTPEELEYATLFGGIMSLDDLGGYILKEREKGKESG